jgi:hypothetical protein
LNKIVLFINLFNIFAWHAHFCQILFSPDKRLNKAGEKNARRGGHGPVLPAIVLLLGERREDRL